MQEINAIDFHKILECLSKRRPVFYSEADFQFELAWELKKINDKLKIRLETNLKTEKYFDIVIVDGNENFIIELKYKTKEEIIDWDNEKFVLRNQSAQGNGRYDFLKDISRIEGMSNYGAAIFLTNDNLYWENYSSNQLTMDENFKIYDGRNLKGKHAWLQSKYSDPDKFEKSVGKERLHEIEIKGNYKLMWRDYSSFEKSTFKYLLVNIPCK